MRWKRWKIRPLLVLGPDGVNLQLLEDVRVEGEALNLATDLLKLLTDPGGDDLLVRGLLDLACQRENNAMFCWVT